MLESAGLPPPPWDGSVCVRVGVGAAFGGDVCRKAAEAEVYVKHLRVVCWAIAGVCARARRECDSPLLPSPYLQAQLGGVQGRVLVTELERPCAVQFFGLCGGLLKCVAAKDSACVRRGQHFYCQKKKKNPMKVCDERWNETEEEIGRPRCLTPSCAASRTGCLWNRERVARGGGGGRWKTKGDGDEAAAVRKPSFFGWKAGPSCSLWETLIETQHQKTGKGWDGDCRSSLQVGAPAPAPVSGLFSVFVHLSLQESGLVCFCQVWSAVVWHRIVGLDLSVNWTALKGALPWGNPVKCVF